MGADAVLADPVLAGAPFLTDDPRPVAAGHWEFNTTVGLGGMARFKAAGATGRSRRRVGLRATKAHERRAGEP